MVSYRATTLKFLLPDDPTRFSAALSDRLRPDSSGLAAVVVVHVRARPLFLAARFTTDFRRGRRRQRTDAESLYFVLLFFFFFTHYWIFSLTRNDFFKTTLFAHAYHIIYDLLSRSSVTYVSQQSLTLYRYLSLRVPTTDEKNLRPSNNTCKWRCNLLPSLVELTTFYWLCRVKLTRHTVCKLSSWKLYETHRKTLLFFSLRLWLFSRITDNLFIQYRRLIIFVL